MDMHCRNGIKAHMCIVLMETQKMRERTNNKQGTNGKLQRQRKSSRKKQRTTIKERSKKKEDRFILWNFLYGRVQP